MTSDSFEFGRVDMYREYGIRMLHYDPLLPQLRRRKLVIPKRSGSYDFGAKYYDDRPVRVECDTRRALTKAEIRELAYILSKKNSLRFWDEPELYYIGRVYDTSDLDYIGSIGYEFTLTFECDPFAYGQAIQSEFGNTFCPQYGGTAPAPTRIVVRNASDHAITGIQIRIRERGEIY